jgi:hypothetical protein
MNPTHRSKVVSNLDIGARWLNTIPHDINAIVAELHRQARASASLGSGGDGRAPKGSHSDPTGGAVVTMADAIARADEETREIDAALALLDETMAWLLTACSRVQRAGLRPEPPLAQPKRQACANCARFGLDVDLADSGGRLCGQCKTFRRNHKVMPHEAICRAWASGTSRITPGLIAEAKAHAQRKRRAS